MQIIRQNAVGGGSFVEVYPPGYSATYVKATTQTLGMEAHRTMDPSEPLTGDAYENCWMSNNGNASNQRFHVDLGVPRLVRLIAYNNIHNAGYNTNRGAQSFTLQGSNSSSAFSDTTYATDTGWEAITKTPASMLRHTEGLDAQKIEYITVSTDKAYRYFAFKIDSNYGDTSYLGVRRFQFYI